MAKKSVVREAVDAAKSVAGAALGAAAVAATGVVATRVARAIKQRGKDLEDATPELQRVAAATVTKPLLPTKQKRAAATRKTSAAKRRVPAKKKVARKKR